MGLWQSITGRLRLTTSDRQQIFNLLGSFNANKLGLGDNTLLTEGYESNLDVYSLIKRLVDSYKAVPTVVEQRQSDGTWEILEGTSIHELMSSPNVSKGYTWSDVEEMLLIYLLASGNSYLIGEKGFGSTIEEVDVLPSSNVKVHTTNDFFLPNPRFKFEMGNTKRSYEQEEIEHMMLFNPSYSTIQESYCGLSVIQVAAMAVRAGNDRWEADANLLQNRGVVGMLTDKSGRPMDAEEALNIQNSFQRDTSGPGNFGKIKITNRDMSYINMAMSSTDLQLVEKGVVNLRAICNVFGLDSSLFNDPANKTFNNRKEAEKALYTNAIMPIANKIDAKHTAFIAKNHFPDGRVRMRKDFSNTEALQEDLKLEAEKDKVVVEGMRTVLEMPISNDSKVKILQETYDISDDLASELIKNNDNEQPIPDQESEFGS